MNGRLLGGRSRLDQVSLPIAQGEPPSPVWAYQYNGQGWRVAKTAAGTSDRPGFRGHP